MASFVKRGESWRAQVRRDGAVKTKTFPSKGAAEAWALREEAAILAGARGEIPDRTFGEALYRYAEQVTPTHKGARWELVRILKVGRDPIAKVAMKDMDGPVVAAWRDRGLAAGLKPASVRREWNLLSAVCATAISEWKWLKVNPFGKAAGVTRPRHSIHRSTLITAPDFAKLAETAQGRTRNSDLLVIRVLHFATETAMRAGEILFLGANPSNVNSAIGVARLPDTKNGSSREVPLSSRALSLWAETEGVKGNRWGLTSAGLDVAWRDLRDAAGLGHIHFHDSRHTAITILAKKLLPPQLSRMTGHNNLNQLMTYYNESAASIAKQLG